MTPNIRATMWIFYCYTRPRVGWTEPHSRQGIWWTRSLRGSSKSWTFSSTFLFRLQRGVVPEETHPRASWYLYSSRLDQRMSAESSSCTVTNRAGYNSAGRCPFSSCECRAGGILPFRCASWSWAGWIRHVEYPFHSFSGLNGKLQYKPCKYHPASKIYSI